MLGNIAVGIAIVGGQDERRISVDAEILRSVGVACAGAGANARENFDVVAIYQPQAALRVNAHQLLDAGGAIADLRGGGWCSDRCSRNQGHLNEQSWLHPTLQQREYTIAGLRD